MQIHFRLFRTRVSFLSFVTHFTQKRQFLLITIPTLMDILTPIDHCTSSLNLLSISVHKHCSTTSTARSWSVPHCPMAVPTVLLVLLLYCLTFGQKLVSSWESKAGERFVCTRDTLYNKPGEWGHSVTDVEVNRNEYSESPAFSWMVGMRCRFLEEEEDD